MPAVFKGVNMGVLMANPVDILVLLMFVMVLVYLVYTAHSTFKRAGDCEGAAKALDARGVEIGAEITGKREEHVGRGTWYYYVTYRYSPPSAGDHAASRDREFRVSRDNYDAVSPGAVIRVCCVPDEPAISRIVSGPVELETADFLRWQGYLAIVQIGIVLLIALLGILRSTPR